MRKDIQVLFDEETEKSLIGAFLINPENLKIKNHLKNVMENL